MVSSLTALTAGYIGRYTRLESSEVAAHDLHDRSLNLTRSRTHTESPVEVQASLISDLTGLTAGYIHRYTEM